jgi:hypothetical protein
MIAYLIMIGWFIFLGAIIWFALRRDQRARRKAMKANYRFRRRRSSADWEIDESFENNSDNDYAAFSYLTGQNVFDHTDHSSSQSDHASDYGSYGSGLSSGYMSSSDSSYSSYDSGSSSSGDSGGGSSW